MIRLLALLFVALTAAPAPAQNRVVVGMVVPQSGPLAGVGRDVIDATRAYLENLRLPSGRTVGLVTMDDGNEPDRSARAAVTLIKTYNPVAFVNCFGTVGCAAQAEALRAAGVPMIGPLAGAQSLRTNEGRHVFAIRPSAEGELETLITHLKGMSVKRVAIVFQDDGFGRAYLPIAEEALPRLGFEKSAVVAINTVVPDYDKAALQLGPRGVLAVLLLTNVTHSAGILKAMAARGIEPLALNLAAQANAGFVRSMTGTWSYSVFAVFTPSPWRRAVPIARDYQDAWRSIAGDRPFSYLSFEAYLNARFLAEALARAERTDLSPRRLIETLETMPTIDFDGVQVKFARDQRQGSRYSDVAVLTNRGSFVQ